MGRFFQFFGRLVVIAIGFMIACFAAAVALVVLNDATIAGEVAKLTARGVDARLVIGLLGMSGLIAHAAYLPALVLIAIGELARRRDWLASVLGGALVAIAVLVLAHVGHIPIVLDAPHIAIDIACGMIAGLVYWVVAGHGAGRWLPSEDERRASVSAPE